MNRMKPWSNGLLIWVLLCLLAGCSAHRDLIVLLPDPDGKIGSVRVTTKGGSQVLDKPGQATQTEDFRKPPTAPQPIDESIITGVFGVTLSAQPELGGRFHSFTLWFDNDTTKLGHESGELLSEIVRTIKNRKVNEIYVVGHTDRVGTELYNTRLSSRRAYYVRDCLVFRGIKSSLIVVSFHGEAMPLVETEDEVAEPLNRRVEVIVR